MSTLWGMMRKFVCVVTASVLVGCAKGNESTDGPRLGSLEFPNSGSAAAQEDFIEGVLYLHSFEYAHAAESFRRAQDVDPEFTMAYWGEALTYTHPVWNQQDLEKALEALDRYGPDREARHTKVPSDRERMYLEAVEILYGEGGKEQRDTLYADAMRLLMESYPEDLEAKTFYAVALLGLSQGDRNIPTYMEAAEVAKQVFEQNKDHPGAAHYIIHSYDDPSNAPRGLEAARAYSVMAPDAGHAQHMTSHIFLAMGMWDDVIRANINATAVTDREQGRSPVGCGHYNEWLLYGYLQVGNVQDAGRLMSECMDDVIGHERNPNSLADMRAAYLVDTEDWDGAVFAMAADTADLDLFMRSAVDLVDGLAAADQGALEAAWAAVQRMEARRPSIVPSARGNAEVMERTLRAAVLFASGDRDSAVAEVRRAAELEASLPFAFGPPAVYKPPRELEGEFLLEMAQLDEAKAAFEKALARTPERFKTAEGLAAASTGSTQ